MENKGSTPDLSGNPFQDKDVVWNAIKMLSTTFESFRISSKMNSQCVLLKVTNDINTSTITGKFMISVCL